MPMSCDTMHSIFEQVAMSLRVSRARMETAKVRKTTTTCSHHLEQCHLTIKTVVLLELVIVNLMLRRTGAAAASVRPTQMTMTSVNSMLLIWRP